MREWTFNEAQRNLGQVYDTALTGEVQVIRRDNQRVVIIRYDLYLKMVEAQKSSLSEREAEKGITKQDIIDAVRESRERDITNHSPKNQEE